MQPTDHARFVELLRGVYDFYGRDVSEFTLEVWWEAVKHLDLAAIAQAFTQHCRNPDAGQFPPKPADIVRHLGGTTQDAALQAWAKVDRAIRTVGTYASVVFDDPIIHAVVSDMGGWAWFGRQSGDEWPFVAKQFETRYRGFRTRGDVGSYPPVLIGLAEADNAHRGMRSDAPVLLGNPDQARRVMEAGSQSAGLIVTPLDRAVSRLESRATA